MKSLQTVIYERQREYGDKFDPSDLALNFARYYESNERIEVDFGQGEIKRGRVGITTGWKPVFILVLRVTDSGSSWIINKKAKVLRVVAK